MKVIVSMWFINKEGNKQVGVRIWKDDINKTFPIDYYIDDTTNPEHPNYWESPAEVRTTKEVKKWILDKLEKYSFKEGHVSGIYAKGIFRDKEDWFKSVLTTIRILNIKQKQRR